MKNFLLGCDWGTSSFRLRLFDSTTRAIVGEVVANDGIAKMNELFLELGAGNPGVTRVAHFQSYLKNQLELLSEKARETLNQVPIIISGMASSSIGMADIPYAKLPFALDGSDASIKQISSNADFTNDIILIAGVSSSNDVMRGEETQLIGLLELVAQTGTKVEEGILIFPGTHSKHIQIKAGLLTNFKTFMTGELYNIICNYSILKNSIEKEGNQLSAPNLGAFKLGIQKSKETGILNSLFTVRTNQLFDKLSKAQNAFYLSGLLIGEEMNYLSEHPEWRLMLCGGSNLNHFYSIAIDELGLGAQTIYVSAELVDQAALAGQDLIYKKHVLKH
jgi:2-dehydro-3-deoxygalactonokinase